MNAPPEQPRFARYPLLDALTGRRSRRFGLGMKLPAGPLAYTSRHAPQPISEDDEAALAFAACGITGPVLADLCYAPGHGGNIMAGLVGRTAASGDGLQTVALFVLNDQGAWFVKRPQNFTDTELASLIELGRRRELTPLYQRSRVRIADRRVHPSAEPLFNINANRWSLHAPGSSYFLPVNDLTFMYVNGVIEILNEDTGAFILDERANFQPAGLAKFARRRGGHLEDDPAKGRVVTIKQVEQFVTDFVNVEQGMVLQNLGLMTQALGLGGFPHFANHDFAWFEQLGFRCEKLPASRYLGAGWLASLGMKLLGKDIIVPLAVGLEAPAGSGESEPLLKAMCPPYFRTMADAVQAVAEVKFGAQGIFRRPNGVSGWQDHRGITGQVAAVSDRAIAAATAYCEYVWNRYGRFPAHVPPFRCVLGHQVVHVDAEFYDRFYRPEALTETQREDFAQCTR